MARLAAIHRHPVKGIGIEALGSVTLETGRTMPWDRVWAVAHEAARFDDADPAWVPCANFARGARAPLLMAVAARLEEDAARVTLTHPARPPLVVRPDRPEEAAQLVAWVAPLVPEGRARPVRVVRVPGRGLTDSDWPSVSLGNLASLAALSARAGRPLSPLRFRMNLWLDGLAPWEEFELVGREIGLGAARLRVREPVFRCTATHADPATGRTDTDILALLEAAVGETRFGVHAEVVAGGPVHAGDALRR